MDLLARQLQESIGERDVSKFALRPYIDYAVTEPSCILRDCYHAYRDEHDTLASLLSGLYAQQHHMQDPQQWVRWQGPMIPYLFREAKGSVEQPLKIALEYAPSFVGHLGKNLLIKTDSIHELSMDTENCIVLLRGSAYKDGKKLYALESYDVEVQAFRKNSSDVQEDLQTIFTRIEKLYGPLKEVKTLADVQDTTIHSVRSIGSIKGDVRALTSTFEALDGTLEGTILSLDSTEEKTLPQKQLLAGDPERSLAPVALALNELATGGVLTLTTLALGKKAWDHKRKSDGICGYGITLRPSAYGYSSEQIIRYKRLQNILEGEKDFLR